MKAFSLLIALLIFLFTSCKKNEDSNACKTGDINIAGYSYSTTQFDSSAMYIAISFKNCDGAIVSDSDLITTLDSVTIPGANIAHQAQTHQAVYPQSWVLLDSCTPPTKSCQIVAHWRYLGKPRTKIFSIHEQVFQFQ